MQNLTYNIDDQLDVRIAKFTRMCLNHHNDVCRTILLAKLFCKNSTFASNYRHLSCKYSLSHHDWHLDMNHLAGKVRLKNQQKSIYSRSKSCQDIIELCEIRDDLDCVIHYQMMIFVSRRAKLGQIQGGLQRAIQDSTKGGLQ